MTYHNPAPQSLILLEKGRYTVRVAATAPDIARTQQLRALCFGIGSDADQDVYDSRCTHILIEDHQQGDIVCCFRLMMLEGKDLGDSYAAQYYDVSGLAAYPGLMMELGRFCVAPNRQDSDIIRLAWAAMTDFVDRQGISMLFGCSSFAGVEADKYLDAFALLRARHLAPERWAPRTGSAEVFRYGAQLRRTPDVKRANACMPPLLRTYLLMGGWVSDHAVIDRAMNTLHVFTGLEIAAIPENRKRLLRALV
ncbi:Ornithine-acyl[acyl carrier protein] N-acyltransferase [Sulfitobacter noctilucicola]|uniref:L-ornithine N(alpha)-acyltransferase n=1 Tax=Sulfitobacter noctilucicola TaxID=1342301 RepID=A0A7W6M7T8_9RHOB|nr:GNAT family N-acetyltransferase [Sulfitobacter noctilucicola]KIN64845.1 Ornithine-acyl[acyl carrier protein] N-acyltransferase [Sulfitobacter noctilucicola]MBB4174011.1 putative hemolysin [Sulfitobacter noctilucicola]